MAERDQRAAARAKRRDGRRSSSPSAPDSAPDEEGGSLIHAAQGAAAAAAVGAAAGAARALSSRTHEQPSTSRLPGDDEDRERDDSDEREPVRTAGSRRREKRQGAQVGDARRVAGQAREALREIAGTDAESVSSLTREGGHWCVTLEVVEVRRVPDSTDVLASYAVHLDDDGSLVSFERVRRYYRSQAGEERE